MVAARVLERVAARGAFADRALEAELGRRRLEPRDAALATELVYGTLRWQRYLDWLLGPCARRRLDGLDPRVLAALRMSAYQLTFLDRVPAFAAVNDAVTLARAAGSGAAAFVNAVLRAFTRPGRPQPAEPHDPVDALALRRSFPTWLAARWVARRGSAEAEALMGAMNERAPLTLRTSLRRTTRTALAERLAAEHGVNTRPTAWAPEGLVVLDPGGPPSAWRPFAEGLCVVQDEASMLVARLLEPVPGETVADVCAAPGTKTTHLAELMDDQGRVLAFDPQPGRLGLVRAAAARLGLDSIRTFEGRVEALASRFPAACDAVLVDAPCSNLGVLRRNPEVKWRRRPEDLPRLAGRQQAILTAAAGMVKPGGRLVYATCSLEPEENEEVVGAFLAGHPEFQLAPPTAFPLPLDADGWLRCLPHRHGTDGFTAVRLRRVA